MLVPKSLSFGLGLSLGGMFLSAIQGEWLHCGLACAAALCFYVSLLADDMRRG